MVSLYLLRASFGPTEEIIMACMLTVNIQSMEEEIQATKAVCASDLELDPMELKVLVEAYGVVATGVSRQRAEEIQAALAEAE